MVWRQLPKLVPAGSIPVSCSKFKRPKAQTVCTFGRFSYCNNFFKHFYTVRKSNVCPIQTQCRILCKQAVKSGLY